MTDVFVSYRTEDRRRVKQLVDALEAEGFSVWWDEQIGGGASWREEIEVELDKAKCVLVAWTKQSIARDCHFVRDEASRAQRRGTYLPVLLDRIEPPLGFGETQAISLFGWKGRRSDKRFKTLDRAIRSMAESRPAAAKAGQPPVQLGVSRRTVIAGGATAAAAVAAGGWLFLKPRAAAAKTIAVLPFANLSGDPAQAYFSDGLAEELRSALARISQLQVVARTSSEAVRDDDAKTAAHKLDVANILAGSVRRSPSTIRISAQLIDGRTGLERWSQSFDRPVGDSLAIQSNIAENVAKALSIELGQAAKEALALGGTRNVAAYDLLLKADQPGRDDKEGMEESLALIDTAIGLDPNYAQAYSRKAMLLNGYTGFFSTTPAETAIGLAKGEAAARHAIALAPNFAEAHVSLAQVLRNQLRFRVAFLELEKAITLGANDAVAQGTYATFLSQVGRGESALRAARRAEILDPLNPRSFGAEAAVLQASRNYAASAAAARRSIELAPSGSRGRTLLGNALLLNGQFADAAIEYRKLPPSDMHGLMGLAIIAARTGHREESDGIIEKARNQYGDNASYQYAQIYAQRGQADLAVASLQTALKVRDPGLAGIKVDPFLDPIRSDARLHQIIANLDFPS